MSTNTAFIYEINQQVHDMRSVGVQPIEVRINEDQVRTLKETYLRPIKTDILLYQGMLVVLHRRLHPVVVGVNSDIHTKYFMGYPTTTQPEKLEALKAELGEIILKVIKEFVEKNTE